ncbi:MAG: hypothetical protein AB8H47_28280 [Bacteroidia bacterium]
MKPIILIIAIFSVNLCFGQGPDSTKVQELYNAFNENLSLREEQQQPVLDILHETGSQLRDAQSLKQSDVQAFRQQKRTIHQEMRSQMASVLDEDQRIMFEAAMEQRRSVRQGRGGKKGKKSQGNGATQIESLPPAKQMGVDALSRSLDFLFEEVLRPTVRNKVNGQ